MSGDVTNVRMSAILEIGAILTISLVQIRETTKHRFQRAGIRCSFKPSNVSQSVQSLKSIVGEGSLVQSNIDGNTCTALIDSGSQVTTVSDQFYDAHLKHIPMLPVTSRLDIFGSTGHRLQFKG